MRRSPVALKPLTSIERLGRADALSWRALRREAFDRTRRPPVEVWTTLHK